MRHKHKASIGLRVFALVKPLGTPTSTQCVGISVAAWGAVADSVCPSLSSDSGAQCLFCGVLMRGCGGCWGKEAAEDLFRQARDRP